jgi:hypothetical protein
MLSRHQRLLAPVFGMALSLSAGPAPSSDAQTTQLLPLVRRYINGEHGAVAAALASELQSKQQTSAFRAELQRRIRDWSAPIAATFALEASAAAFPVSRIDAAEMLALGRSRLAGNVTASFELDWHLAAIALLQGPPGRHASLRPGFDNDWPSGRLVFDRVGLLAEIRIARDRFPHDARLTLAFGIANEQGLHHYSYTRAVVLANPERSRPTLIEDGATGRTVARVPTDGEAPAREQLETTVRAFEEVAMSGSVDLAPTAKLHLGWMERFRGRHEVALRLWREVLETSKDRSTRFLAMVFSGRAFMETARWDEAAEMFRAALTLEPRAQSAAVPLAAVLLAQHRTDDAAMVIERSLAQAADARDPWWAYLRGTFDEWPNRLQALRAQLR